MVKPLTDFVPFVDGYKNLADLITSQDVPIKLTTFDNFVQEVGCRSYPDYTFNAWHIRYVCQWVDKVLASDNKLGVAGLPRGHLKSTILGYLLSIFRFLKTSGNGKCLYISYKDELALYHMANIKYAININPILNKFCKDLIPQSRSAIAYKIGNKMIEMIGSGIFSAKRGLHCDGVVIVDDILGTVDNPMMLNDLEKAEGQFNKEIVPVPNIGCPMFVFGTAIDYSDLLFKLKENPQYMNIWLPAIDPAPDHDILWDRYNKEVLAKRKEQMGWKAFSTEYLLIPVISTNAFFTRQALEKVINKELVNYKVTTMKHNEWWRKWPVIAGYDIGKKGNPSHISIFAVVDEDSSIESEKKQKLIMIHQRFFDGWEYMKQVDYIYQVVEYFEIQRLYYDNTRSEFDERNLPRGCDPIILGARSGTVTKGKMELAANFSKLVETDRIELIDEDRFISQILCVTNDLQAPSNTYGHGDSFISVMLAIGAFTDYYEYGRGHGFAYLGNLQDMIDKRDGTSTVTLKKDTMNPFDKDMLKNICKICNCKIFERTEEGHRRCVRCGTDWG
jgi:hypothetical protein